VKKDITFRPYKWQDVIGLLKDPNERGLINQKDAIKWAKLNETEGVGYTALLEGEIIGCGGIRIYWKGVGEAWAIYPRRVGKMRLDHRLAKEKLYEMIEDNDLKRIQSTPRCDWQESVTYSKWLGFKIEGKMRKYFPINGDLVDCYMMSIIKE
jgi:RimJ/RimL family protein N-acetyltransferase